jgi:hypothetical protein
MKDTCVFCHYELIPGATYAKAQIGIISVHEKSFIEYPHFLAYSTRKKHTGARKISVSVESRRPMEVRDIACP